MAALAAMPLLAQFSVFAFNAYVDPLWILPDVVGRPLLYCVKDERQNKMNRVIHGVGTYDNLILGSSRTVVIEPTAFAGRTLNLSVAGVVPDEFTEQLRTYARHRVSPRRIFIGFDFFGYVANSTSSGPVAELKDKTSASERWLYALARLADWGTAEYAADVFECRHRPAPIRRYTYDVRSLLQAQHHDRLRQEQIIHDNADEIAAGYFTKERYAPDPRFGDKLRALREAAGGAAIIPFIPPITTALFMRQIGYDRLSGYIEFLQHLIDAFGAVHHFSGINDFTRDWTNFIDAHHIRSALSPRIADILEGTAPASQDGFGMLLTRENISQFARELADAICREPWWSHPARSMPKCENQAPTPERLVFALHHDSYNWSVMTTHTKASAQVAGLLVEAEPGTFLGQIITAPIATIPERSYVLEYDVDLVGGHVALIPTDSSENVHITYRVVTGSGTGRRLFRARSAQTHITLGHWNPGHPRSSSTLIKSLKVYERPDVPPLNGRKGRSD